VCAGALIVEEAGGRVTGMDGSPFDGLAGHLIASNGSLHEEMLRVIREFRTSRPRTESA
jgi:myo-inositol-1(or 4)-monophosphatase